MNNRIDQPHRTAKEIEIDGARAQSEWMGMSEDERVEHLRKSREEESDRFDMAKDMPLEDADALYYLRWDEHERLSRRDQTDSTDAKTVSELSGREAVFGFIGWLTTRKEPVSFGADNCCAHAAELAGEFCEANELSDCRDHWEDRLTHPKTIE